MDPRQGMLWIWGPAQWPIRVVLARLLVNGLTIAQSWCPETVEYFQIELEQHDCVIAEGTWSETYADWEGGREHFDNAAEFYLLYPDYLAPTTPNLCAPRPERGAALESVLQPVVERAIQGGVPGSLRGHLDWVRGETDLYGWAHDAEHPELPVLLEILAEGKVLGTVLACESRDDLLEAGFGQGRCSFVFHSPVKLRGKLLATLRVRRVVDGTPITAMAPSFLRPVVKRKAPKKPSRLTVTTSHPRKSVPKSKLYTKAGRNQGQVSRSSAPVRLR